MVKIGDYTGFDFDYVIVNISSTFCLTTITSFDDLEIGTHYKVASMQ